LFYWSSEDSKQEIDFLIENEEGTIIPIEVKSGTNLSANSFNEFMKKYKFEFGFKLSKLPYKDNKSVINVPLYNANEVIKKLKCC
jgi:predicted AAA+ superfamily ATPase